MDYGFSKDLKPDDKRLPEYAKQREERGFDDTETWSLAWVIARFILPRLKRFKEAHCCYPPSLTMKKWDKKLQKMIDGFEEMTKEDNFDVDYKKVDKALKLFRKWYYDLWW